MLSNKELRSIASSKYRAERSIARELLRARQALRKARPVVAWMADIYSEHKSVLMAVDSVIGKRRRV